MSKHIKEGIRFPYKPDELLTNFRFKEGSMHIMLDVEDKFDDVLDNALWDKESNSLLSIQR